MTHDNASVPVPALSLRSEQEIMATWSGNDVAVSIACAAFNHVNYIDDALRGMLSQVTTFPFEILINDDASSDGTAEKIKEYVEKYPHIIKPLYQTENQYSKGKKPTTEFNYPRAIGRYIAFCEGDDYWVDPSKLQRQFDFLEENPDYVACGHDAIILSEGVITGRPDLERGDVSGREMQRGIFVLPVTACFRNHTKDLPNEFRNIVNVDTLLFSFLGHYGRYRYLPEIQPAVYRHHAGGIWSLVDANRKAASRLNTMYWIGAYYARVGDDELAAHFYSKAVFQLVEFDSVSRFRDFMVLFRGILRILLLKKAPWFVNLIRRLK